MYNIVYVIITVCVNAFDVYNIVYNYCNVNIDYIVSFDVCSVIRSELFLEDHKLEIVQKSSSAASSASSYSLPVLEEMMGLKLYTNYRLPNVTEIIKSPMIIFNGPLRLNIYLLKSDVKVNKYVMEYKWLANKVYAYFTRLYYSFDDIILTTTFISKPCLVRRKTLPSALCTRRPGHRSNIT